jgi:plexin A
VTIEGSNLGLKEDDVKGKIKIGDIPCELIDYQVSVKIVCRTGAAPSEIDAPVIIGNTAGYTESTVKYSYKVSFGYPRCSCHHIRLLIRPESNGI